MPEEYEGESGSFSFGWFLAGTALGLAVGMLYAPKSGRETREYLGQKTERGRETLSSTGRETFERGRELFDRGRKLADDAADLFERGRRLARGAAPEGESPRAAGGPVA
jgi:gas vesicle protein